MKTSRIIIIVVAVVLVGILAFSAYETLPAPTTTSNSTWISATGYPLQLNGAYGVAGQQCVSSTGYISCFGGQDVKGGPRNEVYSSILHPSSSPNLSSWTPGSTPYPHNIHGQSCVAYSGYVYCVGGTYDDRGDDVASSYYATLRGGGEVGKWNSTTAYPIPIDSNYCAASSGYVYCVAGNNETDGTNAASIASRSVWYAPLSSSGIGAWSPSRAYPANLSFPSCFASNDYIYCLGGADNNDNPQSAVYFAPLSSVGVGAWVETTAYPLQLTGQACVISSGYIYCVGGQARGTSYTSSVYYAPASSGGIGAWKQAANYPLSVGTTCVISSGYLYCVGGFDGSSSGETNATYYASLASLSGAAASG